MKIQLRYGDKMARWIFPISAMNVQDILDRMNVQSGREIEFRFSNYDMVDLPSNCLGRWKKTDIYKLNVFVERYEQLEEYQKAGFKSVLMKNPDRSIDDMIAMTYGVEGVPVYPADDYAELGEIAVDSEMLPELADCSDEVIELLDMDKVGRLLAKRDDGILLDGYYCMPESYEKPDIYITIEMPENRFFRVLASPLADDISCGRYFDLPEDMRDLYDFARKWNADPEEMCYPEVKCVLPNITDVFYDEVDWVSDMIALSEQLIGMSHSQIVKLKAVMEAENIQTFSGTRKAIECLNEYDFDPMVQDESQFGKAYACRVFPTNFDWSILENCDMYDFGHEVLRRKCGEVTEYGALSGRGQKLYTALTVSQEQSNVETEDETETEDESEEISMGGIS